MPPVPPQAWMLPSLWMAAKVFLIEYSKAHPLPPGSEEEPP